MSLSIKEVTKIGRLSRISVSEEEKNTYAEELTKILVFVEQLQKVNTSSVPALSSVSNQKLPWRQDKVTDGHCKPEVLANTKAEHGCFVVPKVIDAE